MIRVGQPEPRVAVQMAYDDVVAKFTLAGSMISCIATFCVLVSYMVYREELRSFRQALIFNLALAGTYLVSPQPLPAIPEPCLGNESQMRWRLKDFPLVRQEDSQRGGRFSKKTRLNAIYV